MYIGLLEDDPDFRENIEKTIRSWAGDRWDKDIMLASYDRAENLLYEWESGMAYDILFLDIQMEGMDGFSLAEKIRQRDKELPIVFVTNLDSYMSRGYEVGVYRYLMKPVREEEVCGILDFADRRIREMEEKSILIREDGIQVRLPFRAIIRVETEGHRVKVVTQDRTFHMNNRESFEKFILPFSEAYFLRCHRSYLINMMYVRSFSRERVDLMDGTSVPVGRKYADSAYAELSRFLFRELKI